MKIDSASVHVEGSREPPESCGGKKRCIRTRLVLIGVTALLTFGAVANIYKASYQDALGSGVVADSDTSGNLNVTYGAIPSRTKWLIWIHIPKTAGSHFAQQLKHKLRPCTPIFPDVFHWLDMQATGCSPQNPAHCGMGELFHCMEKKRARLRPENVDLIKATDALGHGLCRGNAFGAPTAVAKTRRIWQSQVVPDVAGKEQLLALTQIRHPLERVVSEYAWFNHKPRSLLEWVEDPTLSKNRLLKYFLMLSPPIDEVPEQKHCETFRFSLSESPLHPFWRERYPGVAVEDLEHFINQDEELLQQAIANYHTYFGFVGVYEYPTETSELLHQWLARNDLLTDKQGPPFPSQNDEPHEDTTHATHFNHTSIDDTLVAKIILHNSQDVSLYDHIVQDFMQAATKRPFEPVKVQTARQYQDFRAATRLRYDNYVDDTKTSKEE
eukprot:m.47045 g.47045  ORF g.47045 m.47045 type:complete len:440 (-) comp10953_c0_seq1:138-1457(-)